MVEVAASGGDFLWGFPSFSSVGGWEMLGWVWRSTSGDCASPRGGSPNSPKGVNIVNKQIGQSQNVFLLSDLINSIANAWNAEEEEEYIKYKSHPVYFNHISMKYF